MTIKKPELNSEMYMSGSDNKKTWNCRETATEDAITKAFLFPGDAQSFSSHLTELSF